MVFRGNWEWLPSKVHFLKSRKICCVRCIVPVVCQIVYNCKLKYHTTMKDSC